MDACIFNQTIKGEAPASILYEDEVTLAFMVRLFIWWALEGVVALHPALNEREVNGMIKAVDIKAELAGRAGIRRARQGHHTSRSPSGVRGIGPIS